MKIVKRRGAWLLDWYDFGKRRTKVFKTKRDAEDFEAIQRTKRKQRTKPTVNPHINVADYVTMFLDQKIVALNLKPKTRERLASSFACHILPAFATQKVCDLDRPIVRRFLEAKLADRASLQGQRGDDKVGARRLARGTVLLLLHAISALLREAVEDQLLVTNPLRGLGKALNLTKKKRGNSEIKAFNQEQLVRFLATAEAKAPDVFPAFAVMAFAGLRVGEAMALKWEHLNLAEKKIHVTEQIDGGTLKDEEPRDVEMADRLREILTALHTRARADSFRQGQEINPYAIFPTFAEATDRKAEQRVVKLIRRRMIRVLEGAGLPSHHTPHSLRHSFASILISKGTPIVYVQQALGHASIQLTVDTYGSWLPVEAPGAVNVLAAGFGPSKPVANSALTGSIEEAV